MERIQAEGNRWTVTQEGGKLYLQLWSIYGVVELKPKNLEILVMLEKIIATQEKLVEQGPIEAKP